MEGISKRNEWIESARVIAILLIVLFHVQSSALPPADEGSLSSLLLSFFVQPEASLTLFYFLVGYFTKTQMPVKKWVNRVLSLLIMYMIWNTLCSFGLNDEKTFSRIFGFCSADRVCADYPLWFVLSIIYMILLWPVWKARPGVVLIVCIAFVFWGNSWHCNALRYLPFPDPFSCSTFLFGVCLSRFSIPKIQKVVMLAFPLFLVLHIINLGYFSYSFYFSSICGAAFMLSLLAVCEKVFPCIIRGLARYSNAVFLCYASHAAILVLLGKCYLATGEPCTAILRESHIPIALVIFVCNVAGFAIMKKYTPWILPFIANYGRFPWVRTERKISG